MPHAKRWIFLAHRWLGVLLSAFFAMWFYLRRGDDVRGLPEAHARRALRHHAAVRHRPVGDPQALRAARSPAHRRYQPGGGQRRAAVYLATPVPAQGPARTVVVDAATGARLAHADATHAQASALAFQGAAAARLSQRWWRHSTWAGSARDAFTLARWTHRPLHKLQLHDAAATVAYVSSQTGEGGARRATPRARLELPGRLAPLALPCAAVRWAPTGPPSSTV